MLKRINTSTIYSDNGSALPAGTLTINADNELRIHDGNTGGGNPVIKPDYGNVQVSEYLAHYDGTINFTASPAIITGLGSITTNNAVIDTIDNNVTPATGLLVDNVESYAGAGAPYTYVWIGNNPNFMSIYNLGDVTGWVFYPVGQPEQAVTVTQMNPVGADSLGFSGALPYPGPYTAHSPDYTPAVPKELTVTVNAHNWKFNTDGKTTFPSATVPATSKGAAGDKAGMVAFDADYIYYCKADWTSGNVVGNTGVAEDHFDYGATYGFNKFLTDITGWQLSVPGMSTSPVTVTSVDQNFNGGAQTGLTFSTSVTYTSTSTFTFVAPSEPDIWNRTAQTGGTW